MSLAISTSRGSIAACVVVVFASLALVAGARADGAAPPPAEPSTEPSTENIVAGALAQGRFGIQSGEATLAMTIEDAQGRLIERTLRTRSIAEGDARSTRITFTEPVDQRGVELLLLERGDGDAQQYLYLPSIGHHRRIAGAAKSGRFEGSDFSFADLERQDAGGARLERLPDATFAGVEVYRVEVHPLAPTPDALYGKVGLWIAKDTLVPLRVDFFGRTGTLLKDLRVRRLKPVGDGFIPTRMVMRDASTKSSTTLEVLAFDPDAALPASLFDPAALGR